MKMPPAVQIVLSSTMKTKRICPEILTPDIFTSPRPETMKLSMSDTMFWMSICSMTGSAMSSAFL